MAIRPGVGNTNRAGHEFHASAAARDAAAALAIQRPSQSNFRAELILPSRQRFKRVLQSGIRIRYRDCTKTIYRTQSFNWYKCQK